MEKHLIKFTDAKMPIEEHETFNCALLTTFDMNS